MVMSGLCWQLLEVASFGARDLVGGDVVVAVLVEGMHDGRRNRRGGADDRQPPDVPDQREAEHRGEGTDDDAGAGVPGHVDRAIDRERTVVEALLLLVP